MANSWLKGRQEQRQNKHEEETRHPQEKPLDRHSRGRRHSRRAVASETFPNDGREVGLVGGN